MPPDRGVGTSRSFTVVSGRLNAEGWSNPADTSTGFQPTASAFNVIICMIKPPTPKLNNTR